MPRGLAPEHRRPAGRKISRRAFTLIELLVVIAVAGILAALAVPAIKEFGRNNQQLAATRQVLNGVARARQLAIANRTTVYMVFLPNGILNASHLFYPGNLSALTNAAQRTAALNLAPAQGRAYALISLRSMGDQPGQSRPRYLTEWTTLPNGWIFATNKFIGRIASVQFTNANTFGPRFWEVKGMFVTNGLPFPSADGPVGEFFLPYIAFDYSGRLVSGEDEYIPLARGAVDPAVDPATGNWLPADADVVESPPGNSLSEYNLIRIDWLTGRAKLEQRQIE
ncbi:MAG: type II secretion system GspH family protein [Verrucomicrobia bacterium]|jgi:prepilin-type N-terminal cleavage/methylation domain-containing protein|nr:type II secretion system GspH family protein [Verrucomicrobiota bacterium]